MEYLQTGEFYGQTNKTIHLDGVTLTDTEYTHDKVDWHYHENAYFTFILQGNVIEGNKKEIYNCAAGSLLFHNWQEPHYNIKPKGYTRGFQIELKNSWFNNLTFDIKNLQGSIKISDVDLKFLIYKIFKETKIDDNTSTLTIQSLLMQIVTILLNKNQLICIKKPIWVDKIREILNDEFSNKLSLNYLATLLDIHPVHLSRDFSKYFHCSLGEYIRKIKVEKALSIITNKKIPLTEIAFECGFSDQSHFTRCFKAINGLTPSAFRKLLLG
jgi:AraC family transcriptional regulator